MVFSGRLKANADEMPCSLTGKVEANTMSFFGTQPILTHVPP